MTTLAELRTRLEQLKGQKTALENQKKKATQRAFKLIMSIKDTEEAQVIIQMVAKQTQDKMKVRIEEPVSLGLAAVFDDPYRLQIDFPIRRKRTECDLQFVKNGKVYRNLEFSGGGGAVDVAAFGLQIAILTLMKGRIRPLLVLDEPLKWLKGGELPERGAIMMSQVAKELGITILMVSHIPEQKAGADRLFTVTMGRDGVSCVTTEEVG